MAITDPSQADPKYLLNLVRADLISKVKAELMKDLEPIIHKAAVDTVASLETTLIRQMDLSADRLMVMLKIDNKEVPLGTRNQ